MLSNLRSCCNPNTLLGCNIFDDLLQSLKSSWLTDATAVESDGHHLRGSFRAFFVEGIKSAFDVIVEVCGRPETSWDVEFIVITICKVLKSEKGSTKS
jgi:hypothetical protein